MAMSKDYVLQQLRAKRTRASNVVHSSMKFLLTGEAQWTIDGQPTDRQDVLPSWWPFWSDVLKDNVREAVRAARKLEVAEARQARKK